MVRPINFNAVADIYDSYVTSDFDVRFWLSEALRSGGRVLELMAGTGRISTHLVRAGVDLTCVDYCPEMLAVLKRKMEHEGLACGVVEMDVTQLSLPIQYDLIFVPFNSFSELIERKSERKALSRMRAHLAESGTVICTLQNPAVRAAGLDGSRGTIGTFELEGGGTLAVTSELVHEKRSGIVHGFQYYEFRDGKGKVTGNRSLEVNFRLLEREEFENLALHAGLEAVDLYGNYDYSKFDKENSPYMIWRLRAIQN